MAVPLSPVPNKPDGSCGRKATLKRIAQEPCKGRGGRPGFDGLSGRKELLKRKKII